MTASVGRGTFVRTLAPAADERHGDDWQIYALPDRPLTYGEQILNDAFRLPNEPGMLSLSTGWPSPSVYPTEALAQIAADVFREEGGNAISYLAPRASTSCGSRSPCSAPSAAGRRRPTRSS